MRSVPRLGPTGSSAGATGVAISLVNPGERAALKRISKRYAIDMEEREIPTDEDVAAVAGERVTALLEARPLTGDANLAAELVRRFRKEVAEGTGAEFVAAKLKERDERHARAGATPGSRSGDDTAMRVPGPAAIEPTGFAALRQIKKPPVFVPGRREVAPEWNCSIVVRR